MGWSRALTGRRLNRPTNADGFALWLELYPYDLVLYTV